MVTILQFPWIAHGSRQSCKQMATETITNPPTFRLPCDIISRHLRETVSALSSSPSIALMRVKNILFSPWFISHFLSCFPSTISLFPDSSVFISIIPTCCSISSSLSSSCVLLPHQYFQLSPLLQPVSQQLHSSSLYQMAFLIPTLLSSP